MSVDEVDLADPVADGLVRDASGIWRLDGHRSFAYSDGAASERYLHKVLTRAGDLDSRSPELQSAIRDWTSEYHLTLLRSQLLSAFAFDPASRVLEVGAGCGAVTRHLGERFASVVAVEGSPVRARLARTRTRDLANVDVVCAPFQDVKFSRRFDIVFCIGVLEYSASFVPGDDPYDAAIACFAELLEPDGLLVVAIENQFGLKYFSGCGEDHVGRLFEGLEGYHRKLGRVRTFGRSELEARLRRHFAATAFYYPYPDYKVPQCVLGERFCASERAGQVVAPMRARDYQSPRPALWDGAAASLELARNGMLPALANSFLAVAARGAMPDGLFPQEAALYSLGRTADFATETRIVETPTGALESRKRRLRPGAADHGQLRLVETASPWIDGLSLHTTLTLRAKNAALDLPALFEPARCWLDHLAAESRVVAEVRWLDGNHVDSTWRNCILTPGGCELIDREWVWHAPLRLNTVVIRAVHQFLVELGPRAPLVQRRRSTEATIREIAEAIGIEPTARDFDDFVDLESSLMAIVLGRHKARQALRLRWQLADEPSLRRVLRWRWRADQIGRKAGARIGRLGARLASRSGQPTR